MNQKIELRFNLGGNFVLDIPDLKKYLEVDQNDLDTERVEQPGKLGFVGVCRAKAARKVSESKRNLEIIEAESDASARAIAQAEGAKVTETFIKGAVTRDGRVIAAKESLERAEEDLLTLTALYDAVRQRKDMISSLAADTISERSATKLL